jgi:adenosylhomocysteinase
MAISTSVTASGSPSPEINPQVLAEQGRRRMEFAFQSMPALQAVRKHLIKTQPFRGLRLAALVDLTAETGNLLIALRDGGAQVRAAGANSLTTQDELIGCLTKDYGLTVYGHRGETDEEHAEQLDHLLESAPQLLLDSNAEVMFRGWAKDKAAAGPVSLANLIGIAEDSVIGARRLRSMAKKGRLLCPAIAVAESQTRNLFDASHGAAQGIVNGILRATNALLAGAVLVVAGYSWRGRGVAAYARGLGARVVVCETDPVKALHAILEGNRVMSMNEAAAMGEIFVTVTGTKHAIGREHFDRFQNGAILANAGLTVAEIDVETLASLSSGRRTVRPSVEEFNLRDGRRLYVLGDGRAIQLISGEGRPSSIQDLTLANQALCLESLAKNRDTLPKAVHSVPPEIDHLIAKAKLEAMGIQLDRLTLDQEQYLASLSEPA